MEFLDKLKRLVQDSYIVGVESATDKPVVFIDPRKFDHDAMDRAQTELDKAREQYDKDRRAARSIPDEEQRHTALQDIVTKFNGEKAKFDAVYAGQIATQMDAQFQGLSTEFEPHELSKHAADFKSKGMAIAKLGDDIYIASYGTDADHDIKETVSASSGFKKGHLKDLPGSKALWVEASGVHEGAHPGQALVEGGKVIDSEKKALLELDGEYKSDRAMRQFFLDKGRPDMLEAWIDHRALEVASGASHATGVLLARPEPQEVTREHLDAARAVAYRMNLEVAEKTGISFNQAKELRTEDPQRYAAIIDEALKAGKFDYPVSRAATDQERLQIISTKMGIGIDEVSELSKDSTTASPEQRAQFEVAIKELEDNGSFFIEERSSPLIAEYAEQYVAAVRRRVVPDTTPEIDIVAKAKKSAAAPEIVTETPVPQAASADAAPAAPSPATPPAPADAEPSPEGIEAPLTAASSPAPVSDESDISAPPPAGEADAAKDSATPDHLVSDETPLTAPIKDYAQGMNGTAFTAKTDPTGPMEFSFSSNLLSQGIFTSAANAESFTLVDAKVEPISPAFSQASNDASFSAAKLA